MRTNKRPKGIVRFYEGADWRRGRLLWERENIVTNAGLTALANLIGANPDGNAVSLVGFGSGNTPVAPADTALSTTPAYYNAVASITIGPAGGVAAGSVQFAYQLLTTDYAANPLTIQELGLFGNSASIVVPSLVGSALSSWQAGHPYSLGNLIVDSNSNIQRCTVAGTSQSPTAPVWSTTIGGTVGDGGATWTCIARHSVPTPLIAHVVVPSFPYTGGGNFSGSWILSM